jgi:hypothetical protein
MGERELERPGGSYGDELLIAASVSLLSAYQHPRTSLCVMCVCCRLAPASSESGSQHAAPHSSRFRSGEVKSGERPRSRCDEGGAAVAASHGAPQRASGVAHRVRRTSSGEGRAFPSGGGGLVRAREQPHGQRLSTALRA